MLSKKSDNRFAKAFNRLSKCQFACLIPRWCKSWPSPPQCRCQIPAASCHSKLCLACSGWTRGWQWVPPFPPIATPARRGRREKRAQICVRNDPLCTRRTDSRLEWQTRRCWLQQKTRHGSRPECTIKCAPEVQAKRPSRQNDLFCIRERASDAPRPRRKTLALAEIWQKSRLSHRVMNYCATGLQTSSARVQKEVGRRASEWRVMLTNTYSRACLFSWLSPYGAAKLQQLVCYSFKTDAAIKIPQALVLTKMWVRIYVNVAAKVDFFLLNAILICMYDVI
jgi:hypothetical protein